MGISNGGRRERRSDFVGSSYTWIFYKDSPRCSYYTHAIPGNAWFDWERLHCAGYCLLALSCALHCLSPRFDIRRTVEKSSCPIWNHQFSLRVASASFWYWQFEWIYMTKQSFAIYIRRVCDVQILYIVIACWMLHLQYLLWALHG